MRKYLLILLSLIGLANAGVTKIDLVSNITEDSQLILEHSKEFQAQNENIEIAYHYSHRSHQSHQSHQSHYSHYSSYDY